MLDIKKMTNLNDNLVVYWVFNMDENVLHLGQTKADAFVVFFAFRDRIRGFPVFRTEKAH